LFILNTIKIYILWSKHIITQRQSAWYVQLLPGVKGLYVWRSFAASFSRLVTQDVVLRVVE